MNLRPVLFQSTAVRSFSSSYSFVLRQRPLQAVRLLPGIDDVRLVRQPIHHRLAQPRVRKRSEERRVGKECRGEYGRDGLSASSEIGQWSDLSVVIFLI